MNAQCVSRAPQPLPGGQAAEDGYVLASDTRVPTLGVLTGRPTPAIGVSVTARALENAFLRVEVGDDGSLTRVFDKRAGREVLAGRGNQIWAYHDQPRDYDAWDVEGDYQRSGREIIAEAIEVVEKGPQRGALRTTRRVNNSTIVQSVRLWANSARIDFATRFDWRDRRILLKARFPLLIHADHATFECAFGVCRRPTHANTSWDAAKFEVPVHRFLDLSEPGYGAALLNDGRYGCHARGSELGFSLLRSPILPDRLADEGEQSLTYALLPHQGDWIAGGVLAEAEDLNRPLSTLLWAARLTARIPSCVSPASLSRSPPSSPPRTATASSCASTSRMAPAGPSRSNRRQAGPSPARSACSRTRSKRLLIRSCRSKCDHSA